MASEQVPKEPISEAARILGQRVRDRRHQLKKSQEAFADDIGIHWTFVGQIERGRRNLSLHNILRIAAGLGIDPGQLVKGLQAPPLDDK